MSSSKLLRLRIDADSWEPFGEDGTRGSDVGDRAARSGMRILTRLDRGGTNKQGQTFVYVRGTGTSRP